jgi:hypothetical protein
MTFVRKFLSPLLPYITIGIGLLVLQSAWIAVLAYHLGIIALILFAEGTFSFRRIFKSANREILIVMAVMGAIGGPVMFALWPFLGIPAGIDQYFQDIGLTGISWPLFLSYFMLVNPWLEEYYWRGYLGSEVKGLTPNDVFFSGYHLLVLAGKIDPVWLIAVFVLLTAAAWLWRQVNRWNRGLAASTISHLTADISIMLVIYFKI